VTYALHTAGDPQRYVKSVDENRVGGRFSHTVTTWSRRQRKIDRTISREVTFAKIVYGFCGSSTAHGVRGTLRNDVVQRHAGSRRDRNQDGAGCATRRRGLDGFCDVFYCWRRWGSRSVCCALGAFRLVKSLLFQTQPNDPRILALAGVSPAKRRDSRRLCAGKASVPDRSAGGSAARSKRWFLRTQRA